MITKSTADNYTPDFASGESILIDKPYKCTSFNIIYKLRKAINIKKIGHAGTLDPMATGLLIICTGKKTKEISSFQDLPKTYTGSFTLGKKTPSMDLETEATEEKPFEHITAGEILSLKEEFTGIIMQVPPMYSAIKFKGKNLYTLARKGKTVEIAPREVKVHRFEITKIEMPEVYFEIECSKGTYIRSIANDFGERLGCGAVLSSLRRTKIGGFAVDDALTIDEFAGIFKTEPALT